MFLLKNIKTLAYIIVCYVITAAISQSAYGLNITNQSESKLVESSATNKIDLQNKNESNIIYPIIINNPNYYSQNKESANNTPEKMHPNLPIEYVKDLQPEVLKITLNKTRSLNVSYLSYDSDEVLCILQNLITKFGEDEEKIFFYKHNIKSTSYACFINNKDGISFTINHQSADVVLNLLATSLKAQNISIGAENKAIYPNDITYSNYLNYQLIGSQFSANGTNSNSFTGNFLNVTNIPLGSLVNNFTYSNTNSFTRNSTYWETDYVGTMTSLLVGDISPSISSWGGVAPLGGIQYGTNTQLRPNYMFTATPVISGMVTNPSLLSLMSGNTPITPPVNVAPGQYNVYNLPIQGGNGSVSVNLQNEQGEIYQSLTIPYYTSPNVIPDGAYLYQYNLGVAAPVNITPGLNLGYQTNQAIFSTQHNYGLTNNYTLEVHSEAQQNTFANFGIAHDINWFEHFNTGLYTAVSQSQLGTGTLLGFSLARQTNFLNELGMNYTINQASNNFYMLATPPSLGTQLQQSLAFTWAFNRGINVGAGYAFSNSDANGSASVYNTTLTWQIYGPLFLNAAIALTNHENQPSVLATTLGMSWNFANNSLSANYQNSGNNSQTYTTNYQYYDPTNTWGYNVGNQYAVNTTNSNALNAGGFYNFSNFTANVLTSYTDSNTYNNTATLSGNMVLATNGINLGRNTSSSFAIVNVGNLPNIGILQGYTYIGKTDVNGEFIMPNLAPYVSQEIRVRAEDLPVNTELEELSQTIVPPLNGGIRVTFKVVHYTPATLKLHYANDKIPPVGYNADLINQATHKVTENLIVVDNGLVMINKFDKADNYLIEFEISDVVFQCHVNKDNIKENLSNQYMLNLGDVTCYPKK